MKCAKIEKLLPLFAGGELGPENQQKIKDHLAGCARCQKAAGEYSTLLDVAGDIPPAETPVGFHEGFLRETMNLVGDGRDRAAERGRARPAPAKRQWRYALAGAVVVVLVVAVSIFVSIYSDQSRPAGGTSLAEYLGQSDFQGLAAALSHDKTRVALLKEPVSVDLLVSWVERLQSIHTKHGHVRQKLAQSMLEARDNTAVGFRPKVSNVSLRILCANISKEDVHFENVLRALKWYRQSENKITLEEIISVLNACQQA